MRSDAVLRGQGSLYIFQILRRREVQLFMFRRCGCYFLLVLVLVLVFISSSSSRVVLHDVFVFCKLRESARWGFLDWTLSWRRRTFRLQLRTNRYYRYISCCLFSGCVRQGNIVHLNTLALSTALASVSLVGPDCLLLLFSSSSSSSSSSSREYHYHRCSWWRDSPRPSLPFSSCSCVCSNNKTQRARWRECGQTTGKSLLELSTRYFVRKKREKM